MAHDQMRLHLAHRVEHDAHDDQQAGAAEERRHHPGNAETAGHHRRHHRDHGQEQRAGQRDARHRPVQKLRRRPAGADARHVAAVLLQVVGDLDRIELRRHPEIGEEEDHQRVQDVVQRRAVIQVRGQLLEKVDRDHAQELRREHQDGLREDDGHDAGVVHAQGHVGALPAVDLAAHHPLGVLHRNLPLGLRHRDDARDHQEDHDQHADQMEDAELRHAVHGLEHVDRAWTAPGSRLTMLIVMISEMPLPMPRSVICSPSHISSIVPVVMVTTVSSRNPRPGHHHDVAVDADALGMLQRDGHGVALDEAKHHGQVAAVLGDLLAARIAFARQPLQGRNDRRQQLQDDGGADVGHDAQRAHRAFSKAPPLNRSNIPRNPPPAEAPIWAMNSRSATASTPGVGMAAIRRTTKISPNVKKMRCRSSGIFRLLVKAESIGSAVFR